MTTATRLDETEYAELWKIALLSADAGRLRGIQTDGGLLGASDAGGCVHKAVLTVRRTPATDVPVKGKAIIGTALHETFEQQMQALNPRLLTQQELVATLPSGAQITVHPDVMDPDEPSVTDLKFVEDLAARRKEGVSQQQHMQRNLYGLAMIQAGLADPDTLMVRNLFVSMTDVMDTWVAQEPFSMQWVDAADEWFSDVRDAVERDVDGAKTAPIYFCQKFCPWFSLCRPPLVDAMGELTSPELRSRVLVAKEAREQRLHWAKVEKQAQEPLKGVSGRVGDVQIVSTTVNGQHGPYQKLDYRDL